MLFKEPRVQVVAVFLEAEPAYKRIMRCAKTVLDRFANGFFEFGAYIFQIIDMLDIKFFAVCMVDKLGYHPADAPAPLQVKKKGFQLRAAFPVIRIDVSKNYFIKGITNAIIAVI